MHHDGRSPFSPITTYPLPTASRRIAVLGPLADAAAEMLGPWALAGSTKNCVTTLAGLRTSLPQCENVFAAGVDVDSDDGSGIAAACAISADAEVIVLCLGERANMSGEAASRATPGLPGRQRELAEPAIATGVPVVVILFSGRPLMITWLVERARAVIRRLVPGNTGRTGDRRRSNRAFC